MGKDWPEHIYYDHYNSELSESRFLIEDNNEVPVIRNLSKVEILGMIIDNMHKRVMK